MADRTTPTIAAERDGGSGEQPADRPGLSETPTVRTAEPVAEAEIREFPFEVDEGGGERPAEPVPIVEDEAAEIPRRDDQSVENDAPGDEPDAVVDLTDERPVQAETPAEVGPVEGGARPPEQDDEPSAAARAPDVPNAEADTDTMDITDAVVQEEVEIDLAPERPDGFNDDPGVGGGMATEHHQDLLPTDEEPQPSDDEDEGPGGGPSTAADISPGIDLGMADGSDDDSTDDPFDIALDLDGRTETGNLSEHEQGILDDLGDDPFENPLDDPVATGEDVPGEYDLSGNEAGDGPSVGMTNANPVKGYKWDPIDGYVKLKEGEVDPDRTTMGRERVEANARRAAEDAQEAEEDYYGDGDWMDWVASWFKDEPATETETEDYDPDSAPAPTSPTMDPEIADTHFGIGVEAERTGEIQYADMPENGDDETTEYDGVDYGEDYTEPQFDIADAEEMIYIDPMDQPDVDPVEHDAAAEGELDDAFME